MMTEQEKQLVMALQYLYINLPKSQVLIDAVEVIDVEICKVLAKRVMEAEYGPMINLEETVAENEAKEEADE